MVTITHNPISSRHRLNVRQHRPPGFRIKGQTSCLVIWLSLIVDRGFCAANLVKHDPIHKQVWSLVPTSCCKNPTGDREVGDLLVCLLFIPLKNRISSKFGILSCFVWLKGIVFNLLCVLESVFANSSPCQTWRPHNVQLCISTCLAHFSEKKKEICCTETCQ